MDLLKMIRKFSRRDIGALRWDANMSLNCKQGLLNFQGEGEFQLICEMNSARRELQVMDPAKPFDQRFASLLEPPGSIDNRQSQRNIPAIGCVAVQFA